MGAFVSAGFVGGGGHTWHGEGWLGGQMVAPGGAREPHGAGITPGAPTYQTHTPTL